VKVAVNRRYGGFSLSPAALEELKKRGMDTGGYYDGKRNDPILIAVLEEMGKRADGKYARIEVVEISDDIEWEIEEYDGQEWVSEAHRTW